MFRMLALALVIALSPALSFAQDQALHWFGLEDLSRAERGAVKLDESERSADIQVARAGLWENTPEGSTDALFVYHAGGPFCGSAGCLLEVLFHGDGRPYHSKILEVYTDDVELGRSYENGMRNLRFGGRVSDLAVERVHVRNQVGAEGISAVGRIWDGAVI